MKKETIINTIFIIICVIAIGLVTLYVGENIQLKAYEECIKTYGNCSTVLLE